MILISSARSPSLSWQRLLMPSFQLSVSVLTLLSGHALGRKTAHARLLRLTGGFIIGAGVMKASSSTSWLLRMSSRPPCRTLPRSLFGRHTVGSRWSRGVRVVILLAKRARHCPVDPPRICPLPGRPVQSHPRTAPKHSDWA